MDNKINDLFDIIENYDNCAPVQVAVTREELTEWAHILKDVPERVGEVPEKVRALNDMVIYLNNNKDTAKDRDIEIQRLLCYDYSDAVPEKEQSSGGVQVYGSLFDDIIRLPGLEAFSLVYANRFMLSLPVSDELKSAMEEFDAVGVLSDEQADLVNDEYLAKMFGSDKE